MHTVRDVITLALKKIGVLRAGGVPSSDDAEDARQSLISFYMECVAQGTFGRIQDINISSAAASPVTAGLNQHINVTVDDAVTVDLPATVSYDYWWTWRPCRDYGWGKNVPVGADTTNNVPRDLSVVRVTDQFGEGRATYVYDGPIQRWLRVDEFGLTDEAPLSARGFDGLASVLAMRLLDLFGDTLASRTTMAAANRYKIALVTRHGAGEECEAVW